MNSKSISPLADAAFAGREGEIVPPASLLPTRGARPFARSCLREIANVSPPRCQIRNALRDAALEFSKQRSTPKYSEVEVVEDFFFFIVMSGRIIALKQMDSQKVVRFSKESLALSILERINHSRRREPFAFPIFRYS